MAGGCEHADRYDRAAAAAPADRQHRQMVGPVWRVPGRHRRRTRLQLFGKKGLGTTKFPAAGEPILHDIGYVMHDGGHGTVPSDFDVYIKFMEMHLMK